MDQQTIDDLLVNLKLNIREASSPYFEDVELLYLLGIYNYDLNKTSYYACIRKAENDSISLPSGLTIPDNKKYWLTLAKTFRQNASAGMKRADETWP